MQQIETAALRQRFFGVRAAAQHIGVSTDLIREWLAAKRLTCYRAGKKKILIDCLELERLVLASAAS
jgi:hypothetical protein